jgi:hypothetical protein
MTCLSYPERKQLAFFVVVVVYIQFEGPEWTRSPTTGGKFEGVNFVLLTCVAVIKSLRKGVTAFIHVGFRVLHRGNCLSSKVVM